MFVTMIMNCLSNDPIKINNLVEMDVVEINLFKLTIDQVRHYHFWVISTTFPIQKSCEFL
jgi:hypothetical protein